jgi:predicted RNase H-like nuclease (RuvC/YqgF family)
MSTESSEEVRSPSTTAELERLAGSVRRLLGEWDRWRRRATLAEARVRELESALRDVTTGGADPMTLNERVHALEQENRFLARRLDRARESVKRISARLQFLDEDR